MKEKGPQAPPSARGRKQRPREIECGRKVSEGTVPSYNIIWRVNSCEKRNYTVGNVEINCDKLQEDWKKKIGWNKISLDEEQKRCRLRSSHQRFDRHFGPALINPRSKHFG